MPSSLPSPTRQRTIKDIAYLQECLSEQVTFFIEDLFVPVDENEAWNAKVQALLDGWKEGQGAFSAEVGRHIEAICDAVKERLK